ncbi:glutamyl-tRNA synthetase [Spinellus fusiger]|nr:glutamyl-tRNA synthetase [Spinellus fusiger]
MLCQSIVLKRVWNQPQSISFIYQATRRVHTPVRVRFAPSPTGYLHLGGLRTALYNYFLAKKTGGQFILRIEDTDQSRFVPGATEKLINALAWAGIQPDESPYHGGCHEPYYQSKRTALYQTHAEELIKHGHAYRCFCTPERLHRVRESQHKEGQVVAYDRHCSYLSEEQIQEHLGQSHPFTIRLNVPKGTTTVKDTVYGTIAFNNATLDDTILMKSDGFPTYHLANVVDDHLMKITHVLRGEEWIPSTPKHMILYQALGWTPPVFVHLPLLINADKSKLSKRTGDAHVEHYIKRGYLPESVNNFVALLGWHPNSEEEILSFEELTNKFDIEHINKTAAVVDISKLDWINKQHLLRRTETPEGVKSLVDILQPVVETMFKDSVSITTRLEAHEKTRVEPEYLSDVIHTIKDRISNVHDISRLCGYFFVAPDYTSTDAKALYERLCPKTLDVVLSANAQETFRALDTFDSEEIKTWMNALAKKNSIKPSHIMMGLRYVVTGTHVGASVAKTMQVLGRSVCLDRLECATEFQKTHAKTTTADIA